MKEITVNVDGMMCTMCEAHVQEAVRKAFPEAKKVKANHGKGLVTFLLNEEVEEEKVKTAIEGTGYYYKGMN
ncbi:MAG: heavy-metal-associated domain-containing protein, partial [Lachnospiraceae bacterium]|nr:heavy-metal-associated domain-containing protein [Lachnospiraceae bacterium]